MKSLCRLGVVACDDYLRALFVFDGHIAIASTELYPFSPWVHYYLCL